MNNLSKGIYLGQRKVLIPWGTPINKLGAYGNPIIDEKQEDSISLCWENDYLLGFFGDIKAIQIYKEPNPRSYHIYLNQLYWVSLELDSEVISNLTELLMFLKDRYNRLKKIFGEASFCYPNIQKGMPSIYWELNNLTIGLCPSGWGGNITIAKTPNNYNELKSQSDKIRIKEGNLGAVFPIEWPDIS